MKKYIFLLFVATWALYAQVPATLNYHGILTDDDSNVMDGTNTVVFRIFDSATDGTELWNETQTIATTDGHFELELGSINPINLDFSIPYYLELTIDGETLTPREKLATVSYARRALVSNSADSSIYSVSSSIDHTGRVGHMRFVPGDGGSITESAETSDTDTIYIAIGGGTGASSGTSYPPANVVLGETMLYSSDINNDVVYTVPSGNICYIYSAEVSLSTSDNGDGIIKLDYFDGIDHVFIHTSSAGYVSGYGASTFGNDIGLTFNPPLLLQQGDQVRFSYDGNGYNMYIGWSFTGWEGTE